MAWIDLPIAAQLTASIWFVIVIFCFILGGFFFVKYEKSQALSRPFFLGIAVFALSYGVARLVENIRKYFVSTSLTDIVDSWKAGTQISGLNWDLRVAYYVIAWTGIAILFANVEKYVFQKKSKFLITIAALVEAAASIALYVVQAGTLGFVILMAVASIGFFVPCIALASLFGILAKNSPGKMRIGSLGGLVGIVLIFLGVLADLPEAAYIGGTALPDWVTGIAAPLILFVGFLIISESFVKILAST
ncbi:MAG TPA: hypothetical protein VKM55_16170 [Candidatus Lokiarchaeia archaeon]|nr:hypothetical protein [Candidatus Lokiarchaeia archaeon]